ncbi:hypothetical protein ONZ51_g713 [Trametes cubensis]|uniref:Uncharacterized protein n=1 Tax=Trametes cubensis TaxID=1111947 RepID=A0AAD7U449_9APHY|nr:hypothetical protein ONZ51_g713 [Trametes cubensis]
MAASLRNVRIVQILQMELRTLTVERFEHPYRTTYTQHRTVSSIATWKGRHDLSLGGSASITAVVVSPSLDQQGRAPPLPAQRVSLP